jgi:chitinase
MKHLFRPVAFGCLIHVCLAVLAQQPAPALIGYWHNWNDGSAPYIPLDQIDPRYNVIELAFAEPLPGTTSAIEFTPDYEIPQDFMDQIAALRAAGKKVLISIGGANATVQLNNEAEREQFVYLTMSMLLTWGVDGLDIDLEGSSVSITGGTIEQPIDSTMIRLIDALQEVMVEYRQETGNKLFLTMAPETAYVQGGQSAYGSIWGAYLPLIHALRDSLDILQVQLYNSGSMYGIDGGIYAQGTADFIVSQTEAVIQGFNTGGGFFNGLPPEKVAVALPACVSAAGGGYADTATVRAAMEYLLGEGPQPGTYTLAQPGGYPALRGMMTWSINWDAVGACNGVYSYAENFERIFGDISTSVAATAGPHLWIGPNPVQDQLTVHIGLSGPSSFMVRDLSGRTVIGGGIAPSLTTINVQALSPGSYILTVANGDVRRSLRFVKD